MDPKRIELNSVMSSLRSEIMKAWQDGQHEVVGFEAGAIEVELTTEIEVVDVQGKVSVNFWVLSAEAGSERKKASTQRITFSFTPKDRRDPTKPLVISGQAAAGEHRPAVSSQIEPASEQPDNASDNRR